MTKKKVSRPISEEERRIKYEQTIMELRQGVSGSEIARGTTQKRLLK